MAGSGHRWILTARYGWKLAGTGAAVLLLAALIIPPALKNGCLLSITEPCFVCPLADVARRNSPDGRSSIGNRLRLYQYTYPCMRFRSKGKLPDTEKSPTPPHNDYLQIEEGYEARCWSFWPP